MRILARFGLASRGFVYLVIGWLAIDIARGDSSHEANQRGALSDIAHQAGGKVLLVVLGVGFAAYAAWRFSEVAFGVAGEGKRVGPRLRSLGPGAIYAALSISTFLFIAGDGSQHGQARQQQTLTARAMRHGGGRLAVGVIGAIVIVVGLAMIIKGLRKKFTEQLLTNEMSSTTASIVTNLGVVGTVARGIVFGLAGGLVVDAAVAYKPSKSKGLDGALQTLAHGPYGPWVLGVVAVGLIAFGLYGFAEARWART